MFQAANYISSSAENLYKFLFINGTILVILSMFYPLKEKQDLDIRTVDYNSEVEILNSEIDFLEKDILKFSKESKSTIAFLDSVSNNKNTESDELIYKTKQAFNQNLDSIQKIKRYIDIKVIKINNQKNKIQTLESQAFIYKQYSFYFLIIGIIFFIVGLIGWFRATIVLDKIKKEELRKISNDQK